MALDGSSRIAVGLWNQEAMPGGCHDLEDACDRADVVVAEHVFQGAEGGYVGFGGCLPLRAMATRHVGERVRPGNLGEEVLHERCLADARLATDADQQAPA